MCSPAAHLICSIQWTPACPFVPLLPRGSSSGRSAPLGAPRSAFPGRIWLTSGCPSTSSALQCLPPLTAWGPVRSHTCTITERQLRANRQQIHAQNIIHVTWIRFWHSHEVTHYMMSRFWPFSLSYVADPTSTSGLTGFTHWYYCKSHTDIQIQLYDTLCNFISLYATYLTLKSSRASLPLSMLRNNAPFSCEDWRICNKRWSESSYDIVSTKLLEPIILPIPGDPLFLCSAAKCCILHHPQGRIWVWSGTTFHIVPNKSMNVISWIRFQGPG